MNRKTLTLLSKADIKANILRKFYFYIPVVFIILLYCMQAYNRYSIYHARNEVDSEMTLGNYLFFLWKGEEIYSARFSESVVKIPAFITLFFLYNGFLICRYLNVKRSYSMGNFYLRSSSALNWHMSKLIWCTVSTLLYYASFLASSFLFALFSGNVTLDTSGDVMRCLWNSGYPSLGSPLTSLVLMPLLVLLAAEFIQVLLSLLVSPVIGYAFIIVYYVSSLFICKGGFIFNYAMLLRSDVYDSRGVSVNNGVILDLALVLLSLIAYVIISRVKKEKFIK